MVSLLWCIHTHGTCHRERDKLLCTLLEKIVRDSIVNHLETNGLINRNQHGFVNGKSCLTQLLEVTEIWTRWLDAGLPWDCVYTDFAKAFDSVPHKKLLAKAYNLGLRGQLYTWIENFLNNRRQRVMVGQSKSEWAPVISGIPQGSVLGPVLFLLFINDMPDRVNSMIKLFADDAKLFRAIENIDDYTSLQDDIDRLHKWSIDWQLPFNVSKCKIMHMGKKNPEHTYTMNDIELETVKLENDLGVTFDIDMKFQQHINKMVAKANSRVGIVRRCFSRLDVDSIKTLYKSFVRPILEYCMTVWNPLYQYQVNEIEKIQRRITKIPSAIKHLPYEDRLRKLNLTTLLYRRGRSMCM